MALAKPLHLRLFLEGIEVPVISATVQAGLFAPAAASIQIVPLDEALFFKPRTMVHLFFLEEPAANKSGRISLAELRGADGSDTALSDEAYKLLFTGEVVGFSFVKQPMNRALVLQCLDFSSYWDTLYATMLDWGRQGNAFTHQAEVYGSSPMFANIPMQEPEQRLRQWLWGAPQTPGLKNIGGLAGGIIHMMEHMGGCYGHTLGVNDFYNFAELRCHLMGQIVAEEGDHTAQSLFDTKVFFKWLFNELQGGGGHMTLRDMMKILCQYIYYSIAPNPTAKYDANFQKRDLTTPAGSGPLLDAKILGSCRDKAQNAWVKASNDPLTTEQATEVQTLLGQIEKDLPKLGRSGKEKLADVNVAKTSADSYLSGVKERQSPTEMGNRRDDLINRLSSLVGVLGDLSKLKTNYPEKTIKVQELSRLRTQIFRPDCFMAAPPVCNIIFPEMYSNMSYDRSFVNEVTRVVVVFHSNLADKQGENLLLAKLIVAPNDVTGVDMHTKTQEVLKAVHNQYRVLMDHELHTGIIVREERCPDIMSGHNQTGGTGGTGPADGAIIPWAKKVAQYHFGKYRIGPRTVNVSGRFNPYLVSGFPALVIQKPFFYGDKNADDEQVLAQIWGTKGASELLGAPPQFLGMLEGVQHDINQDGGRTSFSMSHCRTHFGIDDEFAGIVQAQVGKQQSKKHRIQYVLEWSQLKDDEKRKKLLISCTPQTPGGTTGSAASLYPEMRDISWSYRVDPLNPPTVVSSVVKRDQPTNASDATSQWTEEVASPLSGDTRRITVPKPNAVLGKKGLFDGKILAVEVLQPAMPVSVGGGQLAFPKVIVYEEISVAFNSDFPFEDVFRPDWLSKAYDNENVGTKIYQPFFGCWSVVDSISVYGIGEGTLKVESSPPATGTYVDSTSSKADVLKQTSSIEASRSKLAIEKAVNAVAFIYGRVRQKGLDVDEFITNLVRRPIATKADMLGSYDLDISVSGTQVSVNKGTPGFHTLSVHEKCVEVGRFTGLLRDPSQPISRISNPKDRRSVSEAYDVRPEKRARVLKYKEALVKGGRGFVG